MQTRFVKKKPFGDELSLSNHRNCVMSNCMADLNAYQREQLTSLDLVKKYMQGLTARSHANIKHAIEPYISFRNQIDRFLEQHFARHCTQSCFQDKISACCSRDGIVTFWADMIINADASHANQLHRLELAVREPADEQKCIYLGPLGCLWRIRPLVCAMFLCDNAQDMVFRVDSSAMKQWEDFKRRAKGFRWPDRPVLFDQLEKQSMAAGIDSPLMYLNSSPGLLQVKRKASLI